MRLLYFIAAFAVAALALPQNADPNDENPGLPEALGVHRIFMKKICSAAAQDAIEKL